MRDLIASKPVDSLRDNNVLIWNLAADSSQDSAGAVHNIMLGLRHSINHAALNVWKKMHSLL